VVTAVGPDGKAVATEARDGWCATRQPVTEVEFVDQGCCFVF
jgi:hypothetical protein